MKQSELKRKSPLQRGAGPQRKSTPKRSQPKRDWTTAREKVVTEGRCRFYGYDSGCSGQVEAAHVIGRDRDQRGMVLGRDTWWVDPDRVIPLCRVHHRLYDAHQLDVLAVLTLDEQRRAVEDADGIENARVRTCPSQYKKAAA